MKLSELYAAVNAAGDILSYAVWLAAPDADGVDVDLAAVGRVQLSAGQACLYPASSATDTDTIEPEPSLVEVLSQLPFKASGDDLRLIVEIPLLHDESGDDTVSLTDLRDIHIAHDAQEVWLLVRPGSEFAPGLLPS